MGAFFVLKSKNAMNELGKVHHAFRMGKSNGEFNPLRCLM